MFNPQNYTVYRYHSSNIYVDQSATITEVKKACPVFFSNAHRGEKRTMFKGHLIVSCPFSINPNDGWQHKIYVFDARAKDMLFVNTGGETICDVADAKEFIKRKLVTPDENPLTLDEQTVELMIPVKVKVGIFREKNGDVADINGMEFVHIGEEDMRQNGIETFSNAVWAGVRKALK